MISSDPTFFIHEPEKLIRFSYGANYTSEEFLLFFQAAVDIKNCFDDAKVHLSVDDWDHRIVVLTIRRSKYYDGMIDIIDDLIENSNALNRLEQKGVLITTDFVIE